MVRSIPEKDHMCSLACNVPGQDTCSCQGMFTLKPHSFNFTMSLISRKCSYVILLRILVLASLIFFFERFWDSFGLTLFVKVGGAIVTRALSFCLLKAGFCGGLAIAIGFAVRALLSAMMMAAGPEPSGTGQEGAAAPVDPDVYQPLLSDEIRKEELSDRLRINVIGKGYSPQVEDSILSQQLEIEKKIEQALLSDGYSRDSILAKRHQIRGFIFYPRGTAFSESTYSEYLDFMENYGTHRSLPYRRLMEAIYQFDLSL